MFTELIVSASALKEIEYRKTTLNSDTSVVK